METGLWKQFDRIVVFDTETTGIEFGRDEIIELGAAAFSAEGETDCMDLLLRLSPGRRADGVLFRFCRTAPPRRSGCLPPSYHTGPVFSSPSLPPPPCKFPGVWQMEPGPARCGPEGCLPGRGGNRRELLRKPLYFPWKRRILL